MRASKAIAAGLLIVLHATAASAQVGSTGSTGGGAAGGVGSSGAAGGVGASGGAGTAGGVGSSGIGTTGTGIGTTGTGIGGTGADLGIGGTGADLGIGGSVGTGGIGSTGAATGNPNVTVTDPILPDAGRGLGGGSDFNAARATEGDSTINSLNVDGLARSGTGGSAVTSTLGEAEGGYEPTAGSGSPQLYRIPTPTVDVDLGAIRRGLAAAPSATPKPNGD